MQFRLVEGNNGVFLALGKAKTILSVAEGFEGNIVSLHLSQEFFTAKSRLKMMFRNVLRVFGSTVVSWSVSQSCS